MLEALWGRLDDKGKRRQLKMWEKQMNRTPLEIFCVHLIYFLLIGLLTLLLCFGVTWAAIGEELWQNMDLIVDELLQNPELPINIVMYTALGCLLLVAVTLLEYWTIPSLRQFYNEKLEALKD